MNTGLTFKALREAAPVAWRNGGGSTHELLAWPSAADWQVRISVADVAQAGPFSAFPGIERWIAVLEGEGLRLQVDQMVHTLAPAGPPLRFAGDAAVHASMLGGATRDFNLMAPPGRGRLVRVNGRHDGVCHGASLLAVYAHGCGCSVLSRPLPRQTLAWWLADAGAPLQVQGDDVLLVVVAL